MAFDIYAEITSRIISELENGIIPWNKPWVACGGCISHVTGKPYSLLNQIILGKAGEYLTFKQVQEEGGKVRKGEKSSMVVFWKFIEKKDDDGKIVIGDDGKPEQVPFLRYYSVFHIDQCEGITAKWSSPQPESTVEPNEAAEAIITDYLSRTGVRLTHEKGDQAFYRPSTDSITVPMMEQFTEAAEYYSTVFHEMTHSTGHSSRLNRLSGTAFFGSESYSKEELIAEIGASSLVHLVGMETPSSFRNSAAYIQSWLKALHNDKHMIVSAAGKAEKAVTYILS